MWEVFQFVMAAGLFALIIGGATAVLMNAGSIIKGTGEAAGAATGGFFSGLGSFVEKGLKGTGALYKAQSEGSAIKAKAKANAHATRTKANSEASSSKIKTGLGIIDYFTENSRKNKREEEDRRARAEERARKQAREDENLKDRREERARKRRREDEERKAREEKRARQAAADQRAQRRKEAEERRKERQERKEKRDETRSGRQEDRKQQREKKQKEQDPQPQPSAKPDSTGGVMMPVDEQSGPLVGGLLEGKVAYKYYQDDEDGQVYIVVSESDYDQAMAIWSENIGEIDESMMVPAPWDPTAENEPQEGEVVLDKAEPETQEEEQTKVDVHQEAKQEA